MTILNIYVIEHLLLEHRLFTCTRTCTLVQYVVKKAIKSNQCFFLCHQKSCFDALLHINGAAYMTACLFCDTIIILLHETFLALKIFSKYNL